MRSYIELLESMEYNLLTEDRKREEFLLKTYGQKLFQKWESGAEAPDLIKRIYDGLPIGADPDPELIAKNLISYIASFDPSHNGQFTQWMVLRYLKNQLRLEDLEAAKEYLTTFLDMKTHRQLQPDQMDINKYQSLADLALVVNHTKQTAVATTNAEEQAMLAQSDVLTDTNWMRILIPKTKVAACYFGRNTDWCTTWGDHKELGLQNPGRHPGRANHYDSYVRQGPLFIIELKTDPVQIYQYHSETGQFADREDRMLGSEATIKLIQAFPKIMSVIGEERFVNSHLEKLGVGFFSPEALAKADPKKLANSVHTLDGYNKIPEAVRRQAGFMIYLWERSPGLAEKLIPKDYYTPEVADLLRKLTDNMRQGSLNLNVFEMFDEFPMNEWSINAVMQAAGNGKLTYQQLMDLPEDQRSEDQIRAVIKITAEKKPQTLETYPPGYLKQLDLVGGIVNDNIQAAGYLSPTDLDEHELLKMIVAARPSDIWQNKWRLAYFNPEIVTDKVVDLLDQEFKNGIPNIEKGRVQEQIRAWWTNSLASQNFGGDRYNTAMVDKYLAGIPKQYKNDQSFYDKAFHDKVTDTRRYSVQDRNSWMRIYLLVTSNHLSSHILEDLVDAVSLRNPNEYISRSYFGRRNNHHQSQQSHSHANADEWRAFIKQHFPESMWTPAVIKTALTKKLFKPADVPDELVTPAVAARLFYLDPTRTDMAYKADDASLVSEITSGHVYGETNMIKSMPDDRITEPIAFAMVSKQSVENAKKRFPRAALSKRVYAAGVPYTFELNQVPKAARTDAVEVKAVAKRPAQLKYIAQPVAWLNAHKESLESASKISNWLHDLQNMGIIPTKTGFIQITALPHVELEDGFQLFQATMPDKEQKWFLRKGDKAIATLRIKNRKLRLENENPDKGLEKVFREIATKFLGNVSDISVLNRIGIYKNADGTIRDEDKARSQLPTKLIEGIEWVVSPHLRGKLHTAWKDDKAILSLYREGIHYWDGKLKNIDVRDYKTCRENAVALIAGIKEFASNPNGYQFSLINIGIYWDKHADYWPTMVNKMGEVGGWIVYYNPGHRFITIYNPKFEFCGAQGYLLKNGNLKNDHVSYQIKDDATKALLRKTMDAISKSISEREKAKKK